MTLKSFAALLVAAALAGCGIDATPQSGGSKVDATSGSTSAAQPEKREEGEKKSE